MTLEIILPTNRQSDKFKKNIHMMNKNLKRVNFLDFVIIPSHLKDHLDKFLPLLRMKNLTVWTHLDLVDFTKKEKKRSIQSFLSRKNVKLIIWPLSFSWESLMEMLILSQLVNSEYNSCFSFADFSFNFHSPEEVRMALRNHFSSMRNIEWGNLISCSR